MSTLVNWIWEKAKEKFKEIGKNLGETIANAFKNPVKTIINTLIKAINNSILPLRGTLTALGKIAGKDVSLSDVKIPYLSTGTPNIETEGLYHLHEGEMVVPKKFNPNTDGYNSASDNKQIIDLLVSLNASMLEYAERPVNINMNGKRIAEAIYDDTEEITRNKNYSSIIMRS